MQSWLNLLLRIPLLDQILLSTSGPTDNHSDQLPTMVKIMLYLVLFSTPGRVPTSIYNRRDYRPSAIRRQEHIVLGRLSLDQHRTAFSSLYETRTHPFGVAATETDLGFRNHYTWIYRLIVSVEVPAGFIGCHLLELTYSVHLITCLASA